MNKKIFTMIFLVALTAGTVSAQTSADDPEIQKAKEETALVFDLGRYFGFIYQMHAEESKLALAAGQMDEIFRIMQTIKSLERIEPEEAEKLLVRLEDEILTPDQLIYVDQLAIERMEARDTSTEQNTPGSGAGQILSYIGGGAFNPMTDERKTIGKDFAAFYNYLAKKVG